MAYGYTSYAKLVLTFSDGVTRESNIFGKEFDESQYEVTVHTSDLTVTETRGINQIFPTGGSIGLLLRLLGIVLGLFCIIIITILNTKDKSFDYETAKIPFLSTWVIAVPAVMIGLIFAPTLPLTIVIEGIVISLYTLIKKHRWFHWLTVITLGNLFTTSAANPM